MENIKTVKLIKNDFNEELFLVTYLDKSELLVSTTATLNRHFIDVQMWYIEQEKKPFDFDFPEIKEPKFAETIYPSVQEKAEESADVENTNIETEDI